MAGIDSLDRRQLLSWLFCRPIHDQITFQNCPLRALGVGHAGREIEMALPLAGVEPVVAKLDILKLPTIACEVFDPRSPLARRERGARPGRLAQLYAVSQVLGRSPFAQHDFTQREAGDKAEFIGGAVKRIPERFKSPATGLGKHLLFPNSFIHAFLPRFEPRPSPGWLAA